MRLIRYMDKADARLGVYTAGQQQILDVEGILGKSFANMNQLIAEASAQEMETLRRAAADGQMTGVAADETVLLAPIERPVNAILCVGVNYSAHVDEAKKGLHNDELANRAQPVLFCKRAIQILGTGEAIHARPDLDGCLDYEVELAVIIGKGGKDIPEDAAMEHVFGYSVFNDISARVLQRAHVQWFKGKSLDTYSAMGPCIATADEIGNAANLRICCSVNGEQRQEANTGTMVHKIPAIISALSAGMTLEAGDIIATGTPAGTSMAFDPPRFLKKGDKVVCEIEGIGQLANHVE